MIKRFMWVKSPHSSRGVIHIKYGAGSEGPAKCGTYVSKGWWILKYRSRHANVCKRCEK